MPAAASDRDVGGRRTPSDQFAERSPGFGLSSLATFVILPGVVILLVGILTRL